MNIKKTDIESSKNCLGILINSCKKRSASFTTATEDVGLNFYRHKNDNLLIFIGSLNKEVEHKCLDDLNIISQGELYLGFDKGCVAPNKLDAMLQSFDRYHEESVRNDISNFLQSLNTSKIILCYADSMGASKAALIILCDICKKLDIDCMPIIIKPALFKGTASCKRDFKDLILCIDAPKYHIFDEDYSVYKQRDNTMGLTEFSNLCEVELLKFATSIL